MLKKLKIWSGILFVSAVVMFSFANSAKADSGLLGDSPDVNASSAGKIAAAYSSESISLETFVVQSLKSYFLPDQVDARFASAIPNQPTCITPLLDLAKTHYDEFSAESRAFLDSFLNRPEDPTYHYPGAPSPLFYLPPPVKTYVSGNFKFHYVDHATPDTAGTVHQTTLSFVQKIATALTEVVAKSITGDGYPAPPDDSVATDSGGDGKHDVYIMNCGKYGVYGYVSREDKAAGGDGNSYYSFMVLDNNFTDPGFLPDGITAENAMKSNVAHELHHSIQNTVNGDADSWYKECTSTWNQANVYPAITQLTLQRLNYDKGFFTQAHYPLDYPDDHWYGTWIWNLFLTITYGDGTVKKVWDNLDPPGSNNAVTALDTFITGKGDTLKNVFRTFVAKNYSQVGFYPDAADYHEMKFFKSAVIAYTAGNTSASGSATVSHLGARYAKVVPYATLTQPATLSIQVEGPLGKDVSAIVIAKNKNGTYTEYPIDMADSGDKKKGSCGVSGFCTGNITEVAIALLDYSQDTAELNQPMKFTASLAKSITFCIDDTSSMSGAIAGAKAAATAVLDANKAAKADGTATDTYFYTLFSFKDGPGTLRGQSSDEDEMKAMVATLYASSPSSNRWEQESSLITIRQATRAEAGADILMMTDAPSNSYGVDDIKADWGEVLETIYDLVNTNCRLHVVYFSSSSSRTAAASAKDNNGNPTTLPKEIVSLGSYGASGADGYARIATESGGLFFADFSPWDPFLVDKATNVAEIILRVSGSSGTFAFVDGTRTDTSPATTNYTIPVDATVSDLQITLNGNPGSAVTLAVKNPAGATLTTGTGVEIITTSGTTCYLISGAKVTSGNWKAVVSGLGSYRVIATGSTTNPMTYTGNNTVGKGSTLDMSATFRTAVSGATFALNNLDGSVYKPITLTTSDGGRNYAGTTIMNDLGSYRFSANASGFFQRTGSQKIIVGSVSVTAPPPVNKKPNDKFTHTFVIRNLNTDTATTDTFQIFVTSSRGWSDTSKNKTLISLAGGVSFNLVIDVTVPDTAVSGNIDTLSVSVVNLANPLISAKAQTETRYVVLDTATGDVNGDGSITITDVILCLRQAIGLDTANPALADMNGDGLVNITDVILILRKAIGLDMKMSKKGGTI